MHKNDVNREVENDKEIPIIFDSKRDLSPAQYLMERARRVEFSTGQWEQGGKYRKEVHQLMKFGQFIANLRKEQHLTRKTLSEMANVDQEFLFLLEKGLLRRLEIESLLESIAEPLRISLVELGSHLERTLYLDQKGE